MESVVLHNEQQDYSFLRGGGMLGNVYAQHSRFFNPGRVSRCENDMLLACFDQHATPQALCGVAEFRCIRGRDSSPSSAHVGHRQRSRTTPDYASERPPV